MRIDKIDLYGNLLINGSTGPDGQILTYNESGGFAWGTASGGSGPTSSYFKTSGYNYVICETVNNGVDPAADALTNGTNLANAYALAKTLDVGTKSATNRVVVLLMPGDYDLGDTGQFQLDTSFIDLVGISSNPYNTKLRSSTQNYVIQYSSVVDSSLKNLFLYNPGAGGTYIFDDGGGNGDGSYLRWENLFLVGYLFSDGSTYGFNNIYGEFRNIKFLDGAYYFTAGSNIDGIFENIEALDTNYAGLIAAGQVTPGSTLTGTFSNINFNTPNLCLYSGGILSGYYENINILDGSSGAFQGRSVNGTFKNIRIGGGGVQAFYASFEGDISGTYENIQISDSADSFFSVDRGIYGIYKNIEIGNLTNNAFVSGFTMSGVFENIKVGGNSSQYFFYAGSSLSGQFKNIEVGDVSQYAFSAAALSIDATFENIKVGNANYLFLTLGPYLQGTFSNIESGDANTPFYSAGTVSGYFSDIKLGNSGAGSYGCFKGDNGLTGTFKNIEVGDMPNMNVFHSNGEVSGIFKNIKIGESTNCFQSESSNLLGTFENIEFGKAYGYAFNSFGGNVDATLNNVKTYYSTNYFLYGFNNLTGTFSNIEVPQIDQLCFYGGNQLSGSFKNIKIGDLSGIDQHTFFSSVDLTGTFENIEVGNGTSSWDIFKSFSGNISGTFSNIKIGDNYPQAFSAPGSISGSYKDITIGDLGGGRVFYGTEISVGTTIDNLYSITRIHNGTHLKGRLINSTIIDSVYTWGLSIDVSVSPMPIVENCKLITNGGGGYSIVPINGGSVSDIQVLYTATNEGFDTTSGDTLMSPNYNITDAGLT